MRGGSKPKPKPKPKRVGAWAPKGAPRVKVKRSVSTNAGVGTRPIAGVRLKGTLKTHPGKARVPGGEQRKREAATLRERGVKTEVVHTKGLLDYANDVMKTIAPPGFQARDRKRIEIDKGKPTVKGERKLKDGDVQVAGFSPDTTRAGKAAGNIAWVVPASTAVTAYHQPVKTAKDVAVSSVSWPAGLARAAANPVESAKGIKEDYLRRYDAAAKGDYDKFHKRQMKEGAAPEVFDTAAVLSAGGITAGRAAQIAAKGGKLGKGAERIATQETKLRVSGGAGGVKVRKPAKNFIKNAANDVRHRRRAAVQVKREGRETASGIVRESQAQNAAAGVKITRPERRVLPGKKTLARDAANAEVTPLLKRTVRRRQHHMVADEGGITLQAMKAEQARELDSKTGVRGSVKGLSKDEKAAWKYQAQYAPKDAASAVAVLRRHRERILRENAAAERAGKPVAKIHDEIPVIDHLIENADKAFTPRLRDAVRTEGNRSRRLAVGDPGLTSEQAIRRVYAPTAELHGANRGSARDVTQYIKDVEAGKITDANAAAAYVRRVREKTRDQGLGAPAYFKSEEMPSLVHSVRAKGGSRAVKADRAYKGFLTRHGMESGDVRIVERQAAGNIKRKHNWNLVGRTVDQHVFEWTKQKKYTPYELKRQIELRGIDPDTVVAWNPGRFFADAKAQADNLPDASPDLRNAAVGDAVQASTVKGADLFTRPEDFQGSGWQLAPKDAMDELLSTVHTGKSEGVGRAYDITKGEISRILLGNPIWSAFQVGSNTIMAGLAGVTPMDVARHASLFRDMKPARRADIEAIFGAHGWYNEQRHMGAHGGTMTRAWGAMKDTPFYQRALAGKSPLNLFFRFDNAQNNMFRRSLMYNRLKRETYREMGRNATAMVKAQQRIVGLLRGPDREVMHKLAQNRDLIEQYAREVDDFLGNWTRYTAKERHVFSRFIMFYGFLRFSTRLAFYTMPVGHPLMTSILLQIGRLEHDEQKRIFGVEPPPWEVGNLYAPDTGFGQMPKGDSANTRIPTTRLVPFFNALNFADNPGQVAGMANPLVPIALNQVAGKNVVMDQPYTVGGKTAYVQHSSDLTWKNRRDLAVAEAGNLSPWLRWVQAAFQRGKQTSDSSIFWPHPVQYPGTTKRSREAIARNRALIAEQNAKGPLTLGIEAATGTGSGKRKIKSAQDWAARQAEGGKPKKRKVRSKNPWDAVGGGTASSNPWDAIK